MKNQENKILDVVNELYEIAHKAPCKKTVQKVMYLMEEAGNEEGFDYTIHFYGPYSADLDFKVQQMVAEGYLSINYTESGHLISATEKNRNTKSKLTKKEDSVIKTFGKESPSSLELLATTLFVQRAARRVDAEAIVPGVKRIKGSKYSEQQISDAIVKLQENAYF